jgi:hypothetical protein
MRNWLKRWTIVCTTLLFCLGLHWLRPVEAVSLPLPQEFDKFFNTPFNQLPKTLCTEDLKTQLAQQSIPFNCQTDSSISIDKILPIGSLNDLGVNKASLQGIAKISGLDLNKIGADKLQKFYKLVSPSTLLGQQFNNFYQNQSLTNLPLLQSALTQDLLQQANLGNLQPLQSLNSLIQNAGGIGNLVPNDLLNPQKVIQQAANVALNKLVAAIPSFGNYSLGNLPNLQSFSVANAIPALVQQPLAAIPGVNQLMTSDLKAVGLNKLAMSQLPTPLSYIGGIQLGKFDLPLDNDERDLGKQISGGITGGGFRKENCKNKCKFAEISAIGTSYHGATWADAKHDVPDGFGPACAVAPGLCRGPAGNHPFGEGFRVLLTNINPRKGTAQRAVSFRVCDDFRINCSPYILPPGGIPIGSVREGDLLPFVPPGNYRS